MTLKKSWTRVLSLVMAIALLSSILAVSAAAAPASSPEDAKDALADVVITQVYNKKTADKAVHDYRLSGNQVDVSYKAELVMTDEMAIYLQARQKQLMRANFNIHANVNMDLLEFKSGSSLKVNFSSTFLKPCDVAGAAGYAYTLKSFQDGLYTYELTIPASMARNGGFDIPAELIVYSDGSRAYGYEDAKAFAGKPLMYQDFTVADWMHPIVLDFSALQVKAGVAEKVTTDARTWKLIKASGTIEGDFAYISEEADTIQTLIDYETLWKEHGKQDGLYVSELRFGNDAEITGWVSNEVQLRLKRTEETGGGGGGGGTTPEKPEDLNTKDHYSYIIGYKDGFLRPYGTISRGEVATIFFRLLTDEARDKYWCQTNNYTDVPKDIWCNNAISTLTNMGIIDGFTDGAFRPRGEITRAQFAKMAVGFFKTTAEEYKGYYTDVPEDAWYTSYVEAASRVGLIKGFEDGSFRPDISITRAQACVIVNRALGRLPDLNHLLADGTMVTWPDNKPNAWYYADMQEATNSHDYRWINSGRVDENGKPISIEQWTAKLSQRDWAALEHEWSDAHSAHGGGEVVKD